jgi:hypothetical protein
MSIISDAFRSLFASKQKEGESLQDFTRRFKTSTAILESHPGGPIILEKYVRTMEKYDENDLDKTSKMIAKASEGLFTFMYLENSEQDTYRSIISNLNSHKSLSNDQYPRTILKTNNVLSNHKFDIIKGKRPEQKHHNKSKPKEDKDEEEVTPLSSAHMEGKCYCCEKPGHKSPDCRSKEKILREEWAINKSQQHVHKSNNDDTKRTGGSMIRSKKEEAVVGWAGLHCSFMLE